MQVSTSEHEAAINYFKSKRDQYLVEIRKNKNNQRILDKRVKLTRFLVPMNNDNIDNNNQQNAPINPLLSCLGPSEIQTKLNDFAYNFIQAITAGDFAVAAVVAEEIRKSVSDEEPPIDQLIETQVLPYIVNILDGNYNDYERLVEECTWIAANVASGEAHNLNCLFDLGIVPKALDLLLHPNNRIKENAVWVLANIAGDNTDFRDQLLQTDLIKRIEHIVYDKMNEKSSDLISNLMWLIAVLFRGTPYPSFEQLRPLLNFINEVLFEFDDKKTLKDAVGTLCGLSTGDKEDPQSMIDMNCVDQLIKIQDKYPGFAMSFLRIIGHLFSAENNQIVDLLDNDLLDAIVPHLKHKSQDIRKEAAWALSNILAGNEYQVEEVFNYQKGRIVSILFHTIENDHFTVAKECTYALANACKAGSIHHLQDLVQRGIIEMLISSCEQNGEVQFLLRCISALDSILGEYKAMEQAFGSEYNDILNRIYNCKGNEVLELMQKHVDDSVYEAVSELIDNYLLHDKDTDENLFQNSMFH